MALFCLLSPLEEPELGSWNRPDVPVSIKEETVEAAVKIIVAGGRFFARRRPIELAQIARGVSVLRPMPWLELAVPLFQIQPCESQKVVDGSLLDGEPPIQVRDPRPTTDPS